MRASGGVITAGIVAILGSVLTFGMAGFMLLGFSLQRQAIGQQPGMRGMLIFLVVFYLFWGALGIWTGIDVMRLRRWARYSVLIFSGFMGGCSLLTAVAVLFIPLPATPETAAPRYRLSWIGR